MRVVADTNVLVSALVFPGGPPEEVYRLAILGRIRLISSPPLLAELGRVLVDKFGWAPARANSAVEQVIRIGEIVQPQQRVQAVEADPADDRVLEAAAEGKADAIASGDKHLLRLGSWRGIPVRKPADILAEFE